MKRGPSGIARRDHAREEGHEGTCCKKDFGVFISYPLAHLFGMIANSSLHIFVRGLSDNAVRGI
jgi:hypothetical protein